MQNIVKEPCLAHSFVENLVDYIGKHEAWLKNISEFATK